MDFSDDDSAPGLSAPPKKDIWVACLILADHRGEIPKIQNLTEIVSSNKLDRTRGLVVTTYGKNVSVPPLDRMQMAVYALVTHNDEHYEQVCEFLAQKQITVLKEPIFDAALTAAIESDRVELFEIFIKGSSVTNSETPIIAADYFNEDILDVIMVDYINLYEVYRPYSVGCSNIHKDLFDERNLNLLKALPNAGTNMRFRQRYGGTFLHFAAAEKSVVLARVLLDSGADINAVTLHGRTAIHWAVEHFKFGDSTQITGFLDFLLLRGADINEPVRKSDTFMNNFEGATPLHFALENKELELAAFFFERGANVNAESNAGSVLQCSLRGPQDNTLALVLAHGPDLNSECNQKAFRDVLKYHVLFHPHSAAPSLLEEYGFRIKPRDGQDMALLVSAADHGNIQLLNVLLKWGAGVHYRSHAAPRDEEKDIVKKLLTNLLPRRRNFETLKFLLVLDDVRSGVTYGLFDRFSKEIVAIAFNKLCMLKMDSPFEQREGLEEIIQKLAWKVKVLELNRNEMFFLNRAELAGKPWFPVEVFESTPPGEYFTQVTEMREQTIGGSTFSFYDFLNKHELDIVKLLKNPGVVQYLKSGQYKERFPYFESLIEWRFLRANYRRSLLDKGMIMFNYLFRDAPKLPDELLEWVLECLTNLDLLVFVNIGNMDADFRIANRSNPAQDLADVLENL